MLVILDNKHSNSQKNPDINLKSDNGLILILLENNAITNDGIQKSKKCLKIMYYKIIHLLYTAFYLLSIVIQ